MDQDSAKAYAWLNLAAFRGHKGAQQRLPDLAQLIEPLGALEAQREIAEAGNLDAQFLLGGMYAGGEGMPPDYPQALTWWRRAAGQGHPGAQFNLGVMYAKGKGVTQDYEAAMEWYRLAAEQGDPNAQFNLGGMYLNGEGVAKNALQASIWFKLAASQGHEKARELLDKIKTARE